MSFGYAIGDVIAVVNLFERIAQEVQNYRDAPRHFQQLGAELSLLRTTIQSVMQVKATVPHDLEFLERIRAIAIHCRPALQSFMDKMRSSESSLGNMRSAGGMSAIGRRLHWSMITRKDVDELRKILLSEMVAINTLLGVQQLSLLQRLIGSDDSKFKRDVTKFIVESKDMMSKSLLVLNGLEDMPRKVEGLHGFFINAASRQQNLIQEVQNTAKVTESNTEAILSKTGDILKTTQEFRNQAFKAMLVVISVMSNLKKLMILIATFSRKAVKQIEANTRMLLNIHQTMKRMARNIEAIPLHLTLPILRFDDALGESWALPFQACAQWDTFKEMLQTVVFGNNRIGSQRVALNQFVIMSAKDGRILAPHTWNKSINAGDHISQSMILEEAPLKDNLCQFPDCDGSLATVPLTNGGYNCPRCYRWSAREQKFGEQLVLPPQLVETPIGPLFPPRPPSRPRRPPEDSSYRTGSLPAFNILEDEVSAFRRIHVVENIKAVENLDEALLILRSEPEHAGALKYWGWWLLTQSHNSHMLSECIDVLERSLKSSSNDSQTWYMIARACLYMDKLPQAYHALRQATITHYFSPSYWLTIGIMYFRSKQYYDSHEGLCTAIRCNPKLWQAWFNLGVLYEHVKQWADAGDAFQRYTELSPDDEITDRISLLKNVKDNQPIEGLQERGMKDIDLLFAASSYVAQESSQNIHIAPLRSAESGNDDDEDEVNSAFDTDGDDSYWTDYEEGDEEGQEDEG